VIGGGEACPLAAAGVEVLVAGIERQREQALRSPLEAVLAAVAGLDRGAAIAGEDVHNLLEQVALRLALGARRWVEHEDRDEVAAPLEVDDAAFDPEARPPLRRYLDEIDTEILGDRHPFPLGPAKIRIEQQLGSVRLLHRLVHWVSSQST